MACNCCIALVKREIMKQGLHVHSIKPGHVILHENVLSVSQEEALHQGLAKNGFARIHDRKEIIIETIKNTIIQTIHGNGPKTSKINWSAIIKEHLQFEYNYLGNLFSSIEGITIGQYIIRQKIERVKELLLYDELSLTQIAEKVGYSNVAHLSAQFKKITGLTPSDLKKTKQIDRERRSIDAVFV
jgi:YesN/AraC family two-component response regulator